MEITRPALEALRQRYHSRFGGWQSLSQLPLLEQPCLSQMTQLQSLAVQHVTAHGRHVKDALSPGISINKSLGLVAQALQPMTRMTSLQIGGQPLSSEVAARILTPMTLLASVCLSVNLSADPSAGSAFCSAFTKPAALTSLEITVNTPSPLTPVSAPFLNALGTAVIHQAHPLQHLGLHMGAIREGALQNSSLASSMEYLVHLRSLTLSNLHVRSPPGIIVLLQALPVCSPLQGKCITRAALADAFRQDHDVLFLANMRDRYASYMTGIGDCSQVLGSLNRIPALAVLSMSCSGFQGSAQNELSLRTYLCSCTSLTRLELYSNFEELKSVPALLRAVQHVKVLELRHSVYCAEIYARDPDIPFVPTTCFVPASAAEPADVRIEHLEYECIAVNGSQDLSSVLRSLTTLTHLKLTGRFDNEFSVSSLSNALQCLANLRLLSLTDIFRKSKQQSSIDNPTSDDLVECFPCMPQLKHLSLVGMKFDSLQMLCVPFCMLTNLESFGLVRSEVTDSDAKHVGSALKCLKSVKSVDLSGNELSDVGVDDLLSTDPFSEHMTPSLLASCSPLTCYLVHLFLFNEDMHAQRMNAIRTSCEVFAPKTGHVQHNSVQYVPRVSLL